MNFMKWTRLFFLLFLVPNLIYASSSYYLKDYKKDADKISVEWKRHDELVQQFNGLGLEEKGQNIILVNESIACCQRAIGHCDHILKKIGEKSKSDRKEWEKEQNQAQESKNILYTEINELQKWINYTLRDVAFEKAKALHEEGEKKAASAILKNQNCPPRRLNNVDIVVSVLSEIAHLYDEATSKELEALAILTSSPSPIEENVVAITQAIEHYQAAANKYNKEAAEWAATVLAQKAVLKARLAVLKEDRRLFEEKGLKRGSYEVQKQT